MYHQEWSIKGLYEFRSGSWNKFNIEQRYCIRSQRLENTRRRISAIAEKIVQGERFNTMNKLKIQVLTRVNNLIYGFGYAHEKVAHSE